VERAAVAGDHPFRAEHGLPPASYGVGVVVAVDEVVLEAYGRLDLGRQGRQLNVDPELVEGSDDVVVELGDRPSRQEHGPSQEETTTSDSIRSRSSCRLLCWVQTFSNSSYSLMPSS